jgi:hypothetical protein
MTAFMTSYIVTIMRRPMISIFLVAALAGCAHVWKAPQFGGQVVDSKGQPLDGVAVSRKCLGETAPTKVAQTDHDGKFEIPANREMIFPFLFGDPIVKGVFTLSKPGYTSVSREWVFCCGDAFHAQTLASTPGSKIVMKQESNLGE